MKIGAIICEFNPLHNGHLKLINYAKNQCDTLIAIMSGNLTQRGDIACIEKHKRAKTAILSGFDLVVEIPTLHTISSATFYAKGAVEIAKKLKVTDLYFGTEHDNIKDLIQISQELQKESVDNKIKEYLNQGFNYPTSISKAISLPNINSEKILEQPNNTLSIEYIKFAQKHKINVHSIQRESSYHSQNIKDGVSSTAIRTQVLNKDFNDLKNHMPDYSYQLIKDIKNIDKQLYSLLLYKINTTKNHIIAKYYDVTEGIENRIKNTTSEKTLNDFILNIKSKRYTFSRIKRILLHILLEISNSKAQTFLTRKVNYINVLAIKKERRDLLSFYPFLITKYNDIKNTNLEKNFHYLLNIRADNLFDSLMFEKNNFNMIVV